MKGAVSRKAVVLLSGGLDSILALKMMIDQRIDLTAVNFNGPFCSCTTKTNGSENEASRIADLFNVPIRLVSMDLDFMQIVESPRHGRGRGMNPCIDCRIYMLRKVAGMMAEIGASFVVTGEVLGQRPLSQNRQAMKLIDKESGLAGRILRPLSAQLFPPTLPEEEGIVDRSRLLAISGRSRKPQIEMAERFGVRDYPCPAGGCLLTDPEVAARLRDLFVHVPGYAARDLSLLTIGRHFRVNPALRVILGRTREENEKLLALAVPGDVVFTPVDFRGPTVLALGEVGPMPEGMIGEMIPAYSQDKVDAWIVRKEVVGNKGSSTFSGMGKKPRDTFASLRIKGV